MSNDPRRWASAIVLALTACRGGPPVEADLAIVHVDVVPMTADTVLENRTVLVRDGRIAEILGGDAVRVSQGTPTIDGTGRYLMPGLVDGHAHVRARGVLDLFLSQGFTTVRNMHGGLGDPLVWARAISAGELAGPTLVNASPVLAWDTPGFTLPGRQPITSLDTLEAYVHEIADSGYASIKIVEFPRDAFETLMAAAERVGLPVTGHPPITRTGYPNQDLTIDEVLGSGMTVVEHVGELITYGLGPDPSDTVASADLARRVAASGVAVTTTISTTLTIASALELDSAYLTPEMYDRAVRHAGEEEAELLYRMPQIWRENGFTRIDHEFLALFVRQLQAARVPLMVGTDAHTALEVAGESAVSEMLHLHAFGLTPFESLKALTATPADVLGESGEWGTVEVGARADLVLLDANPLADPTAVRSLVGVVVGGQWLDRPRLDEMRTRAEEGRLACRRARCD